MMDCLLWVGGIALGLWLTVKVLLSRPVTMVLHWLLSWLTIWNYSKYPFSEDELQRYAHVLKGAVPGQPFDGYGVSIRKVGIARGHVLAATIRTRLTEKGGYYYESETRIGDVRATLWTECTHGWFGRFGLPHVARRGWRASRARSYEPKVGAELIIIYDQLGFGHIALQPGAVGAGRAFAATAN
jgi:hypothetical protein